ncbi:MAG: type III pantothenate kinase [Opitutales bacterium]
MNLVCVDLGNTTIHCGALARGEFHYTRSLATELFRRNPTALTNLIEEIAKKERAPWEASFCSVVPALTTHLEDILEQQAESVFQLTPESCSGLTISHPNPSEIGPDRLANAIAAQVHHGTPSIVIDLGTATTFDLVGSTSGYVGGIIAPGLALMTDYLAERTALLPNMEPNLSVPDSLIGRSTEEAMQIGCSLGFRSMIEGILEGVRSELANHEKKDPLVIVTGGAAKELTRTLQTNWTVDSLLTLRGLVEAKRRNGGH